MTINYRLQTFPMRNVMRKEPRVAVTVLGGLTGAAVALLGILLGASVANLTSGGHSEPSGHAEHAEGH